VPFQAFEAADGWLVVGCAKEKFWHRLVEVLDRPDLGADPRFATFADRDRHRDVLVPVLEDLFRERSVEAWLEPLYAARIPCAPIHEVAGALEDPHTLARALVVETEHPRFGAVRSLRSPVRVGPAGADAVPARGGPPMGRDTDDVLTTLGYDDDRVAALRAGGAFGPPPDPDDAARPLSEVGSGVEHPVPEAPSAPSR
jgi:crotonobetainyl-CoA:carnitine CoA-transferase CaiB-like acyl-CoA transferase